MTTQEIASTLGTCTGEACLGEKHRNPCSRAMLDGARSTVAEYDALGGPAGHRYRVERVESSTGDALELLSVRRGVERRLLGRFEIVDGARAIRVCAELAVDDLVNELLCSGAIGHVCDLCQVGYETREALAAHVAAKECWGDCERCERAPATIAETNAVGVAVRVCAACSTEKVTAADLDRARLELSEKIAANATAEVRAATERLAAVCEVCEDRPATQTIGGGAAATFKVCDECAEEADGVVELATPSEAVTDAGVAAANRDTAAALRERERKLHERLDRERLEARVERETVASSTRIVIENESTGLRVAVELAESADNPEVNEWTVSEIDGGAIIGRDTDRSGAIRVALDYVEGVAS